MATFEEATGGMSLDEFKASLPETARKGLTAGDESMKAAGRSTWSEEDWDAMYEALQKAHADKKETT